MGTLKQWYIDNLEGNFVVDPYIIGDANKWECSPVTEWRGNPGDPAQYLFRRIDKTELGYGQIDVVKAKVEAGTLTIELGLSNLIKKWER